MSRINSRWLLTLCLVVIHTSARADSPSFLPSFYEAATKIDGQTLPLVSEGVENGVNQAIFASPGGSNAIFMGQVPCDRTNCAALFNANIRRHAQSLESHNGEFLNLVQHEYASTWQDNGASYVEIVLEVPDAIIVWKSVTKASLPASDAESLATIRSLTDRHRFEIARSQGNIDRGLWAEAGYRYANDLFRDGSDEAALEVLRQVVAWAPFHLDAHLSLAEHTRNDATRRASALAVWENAEDPELSHRAGKLLMRSAPNRQSLPLIERNMQGLQLVLIPLPPCDIRLQEAAGKLYSDSLKIPIRIARLPTDWVWDTPDRVFRERDIQKLLQSNSARMLNFDKWIIDDYSAAVSALAANADPLTRYQFQSFLREIEGKPGQYDVATYVPRFARTLEPYFSGDKQTMFVGVTGANIFAGDANYVFSTGAIEPTRAASILSYAVMEASMSGAQYQSRGRLAERLAKEMVPASLKQLQIPRPADPRDPYSYSNGVARLDQKTMRLSEQTRTALDAFRDR